MKYLLVGGVMGFLAGGILGGAAFGPIGSLVGSILGIPIGALILWTMKVARRENDEEARRSDAAK